MQVFLLALSILLLTVVAANRRVAENSGNVTRVIKTEKISEKKSLPIKDTEHDFSIRTAIIDMFSI